MGQETQLPVSCSSWHGSKPIPPIPALHHWHAACKGLLSIPHATHFSRPRPPSIYKNNLSPTQFVLPSTYYTKCTSITKTCVTLLHIHIVASEQYCSRTRAITLPLIIDYRPASQAVPRSPICLSLRPVLTSVWSTNITLTTQQHYSLNQFSH